MVINKSIFVNVKMKKMMKNKHFFQNVKRKSKQIETNISNFCSDLILHHDMYNWIVSRELKDSYNCIVSEFGTLTAYEYFHNELFFDRKMLRQSFSKSIPIILKTTENFLADNFKNQVFCICLSTQYGRYANITLKIHLQREGEVCIDIANLEKYNQPVLYEILNT